MYMFMPWGWSLVRVYCTRDPFDENDSIQILEAKKFVSLCKERSINAELVWRDDSMMARISNQ